MKELLQQIGAGIIFVLCPILIPGGLIISALNGFKGGPKYVLDYTVRFWRLLWKWSLK